MLTDVLFVFGFILGFMLGIAGTMLVVTLITKYRVTKNIENITLIRDELLEVIRNLDNVQSEYKYKDLIGSNKETKDE